LACRLPILGVETSDLYLKNHFSNVWFKVILIFPDLTGSCRWLLLDCVFLDSAVLNCFTSVFWAYQLFLSNSIPKSLITFSCSPELPESLCAICCVPQHLSLSISSLES
jgi:hypothetical protein